MNAIVDRSLALQIHAQLLSRAVAASTRASAKARLDRIRGEQGEGVISAAIVVLIMAVLGAAMFVAYQQMFTKSSNTVNDKINDIANSNTPAT